MENYIGSICPHCSREITGADAVKVCPACGIAHHESCWIENQGCTTFGCPQQHYEAPAPVQPAETETTHQPAKAPAGFARRNLIPILGLVAGIVLLCVGLFTKIPSDYISYYRMEEYVGGDAYNYIIEASLRGGQIAGAMVSKAVYISAGLLMSYLSALKLRTAKTDA